MQRALPASNGRNHLGPRAPLPGWGWQAHAVFIFFALLCNAIVTAMLLLGGSAVIEQITGLDRTWSVVVFYNRGLQ